MMKSESGSVLPLGIGVIAASVVFVLVMLEVIGCQFQTLQLKQVADVLALQVAEDLHQDKIAPVVNLEYNPVVGDTLKQVNNQMGLKVDEVSVASHDGKTIDATVCAPWRSITGFTLGNAGKLCANSKARAI